MAYLQFIVFVSVFLAILFGTHLFVFRFFFDAFSPVDARFRYAAVALSLFLPSCFFLASFLAHSHDSLFARTAYLLSSVWLGLFVNILLAALSVWIIRMVVLSAGADAGGMALPAVALAVALTVSGYGVWSALHPQVRHVEVTVRDLPESWKGKTVVQLSDVHLGHIYRSKYLEGVVDRVNALHPEAVVITGDLFDGMDGNLSGLAAPLGNLRSTYGTYFVTGNHETYLGVSKALSALEGTSVRILDDEVADLDGLAVVGVSYPDRNSRKDIPTLLETLHPQYADRASILLYHAPSDIVRMAESGIGLQLSGHTHRGQQFPFQLITRLVHKGFDYGLHHVGDYSLYTSSGIGTWGPPMRIGTRSEIVAITLR